MADKEKKDHVLAKFIGMIIAVSLLGLGIMWGAHQMEPTSEWRELAQELGIALITGVVVTLLIEYYAAKRREEDERQHELEVRAGVTDAVMGRIVPPPVWEEIKNNIIAPGVLCEEWALEVRISRSATLTVHAPGGDTPFVSVSSLTYKLSNGMKKEQPIDLLHELEYLQAQENGRDLPEFTNLVYQLSSGEKEEYDGNKLRQQKLWTGNLLKVSLTLPPSPTGWVQVSLERREAILSPWPYLWFMKRITTNPKVTIQTDVEGLTFDVVARHPDEKSLKRKKDGHTWEFEGVMLPGQALEIMPKQDAAAKPGTAAAAHGG